jgi:hypothetical protein
LCCTELLRFGISTFLPARFHTSPPGIG